jgi:hypothetical protein
MNRSRLKNSQFWEIMEFLPNKTRKTLSDSLKYKRFFEINDLFLKEISQGKISLNLKFNYSFLWNFSSRLDILDYLCESLHKYEHIEYLFLDLGDLDINNTSKGLSNILYKHKLLSSLHLVLYDNKLSNDGTFYLLETLSKMPNITYLTLDLSRNFITNISVIYKQINQLTKLKSLSLILRYNHFTFISSSEFIFTANKFPDLETLTLDLTSNNISQLATFIFADAIAVQTSLKTLNLILTDNPLIVDEGFELICNSISKLKRLSKLKFHFDNVISKESSLYFLSTLKGLKISKVELYLREYESFFLELNCLPELNSLTLIMNEKCCFFNIDISKYPYINLLKNLREFRLTFDNKYDSGNKQIEKFFPFLMEMSNLSVLGLDIYFDIDLKMLIDLSLFIKSLKFLTTLNLKFNLEDITEEGFNLICNSISYLKNLNYLSIKIKSLKTFDESHLISSISSLNELKVVEIALNSNKNLNKILKQLLNKSIYFVE